MNETVKFLLSTQDVIAAYGRALGSINTISNI